MVANLVTRTDLCVFLLDSPFNLHACGGRRGYCIWMHEGTVFGVWGWQCDASVTFLSTATFARKELQATQKRESAKHGQDLVLQELKLCNCIPGLIFLTLHIPDESWIIYIKDAVMLIDQQSGVEMTRCFD